MQARRVRRWQRGRCLPPRGRQEPPRQRECWGRVAFMSEDGCWVPLGGQQGVRRHPEQRKWT